MNNSTKIIHRLPKLRQTLSTSSNFVKNVFPFILQVKKTSTKGYR